MWDLKTIGMGIVGILIFLIGWQMGRVMSPYYASTPIVFEASSAVPSEAEKNNGSVEALQQLRDASVPSLSSNSPKTAVSSAPASQSTGGQFVASKNSSLFHDISCAAAKSIKPANQRWFATAETALSAGLTPSACTKKLLNIK